MKISKFQIITIALFVVFILAGVAAFATFRGNSGDTQIAPITVWGTFPAEIFDNYVTKINNDLQQPLTITYTQKNATQFSQEFISALARGQGPDAILIPADMILPHVDKIYAIPYSAYSRRDFMNTYIQEAQSYLMNDGVLAIPFTIDPLIMYWNRDTFNGAGIATYPRYWDEFTALNKAMTVKDVNGNVRKSAIAMGDFSNINNARELLGSLILQSGNPVTIQNSDGTTVSTLKNSATSDATPAVQFFTQFVNPSDPNYSWNKSMPNTKTSFLSGVLATYFGFSSELADLREKNPNLNFDAAPLPQPRTGGSKAIYGRMFGFSVLRSSQNANSAFQVISILTSPQYMAGLSETVHLPSVRTDIIAKGSPDPYISVFNQAALITRSWLDADPAVSASIFASMISSINSGQKSYYQALQDASDEYDVALKRALQ